MATYALGSMGADEKGINDGGGGRPSIAGRAVAIGPPWNGVAMLPAHLLLQHFHDCGVDGEGIEPDVVSRGGCDTGALLPDDGAPSRCRVCRRCP